MADRHQTRMMRQQALPFIEVKIGAEPAYSVRPHSHETLSVGFVEKGSSLICCRPHEFRLGEGDAILIPPDVIHLCQPHDPARFRFRMLHICPAWLKESLGIEAAGLSARSVSLSRSQQQRAGRFFKGFAGQDRFLDETNAILYLDHLLNRVFRLPGPRPATPPLAQDCMAAGKRFLDEAYDRDIQLNDLAELAGTSKFALIRQFKRLWQITPHAYLINRRILAAKSLLMQGHSVADTAAACGFFDQSHFVKTFKHYVGICPADYQK